MGYAISTKSAVLGLLLGLSAFAHSAQVQEQKSPNPTPEQFPPAHRTDATTIERLIEQLGSDKFSEREAAAKALEAIGEPALRALRMAQKTPDAEVRRRAANLVKLLTRRRAPARAKAWATIIKRGGRIDSDDGTPDGQIGCVNFLCMPVGNDGLALLPWLDDARGVSLLGTRITDDGLIHLKTFYRLHVLDLGETTVTDAGLKHIGELKTLASLAIYGTQVTDAGLTHLKNLNKLCHLDLSHTRITDAGLDHIKTLSSLTWLNLSHTQVTDAGLAKLKALKKLNFLDLSDTSVTDAGLVHLKEIRTLETLDLTRTKVTSRGMADLRRSLPKLGFVR